MKWPSLYTLDKARDLVFLVGQGALSVLLVIAAIGATAILLYVLMGGTC